MSTAFETLVQQDTLDAERKRKTRRHFGDILTADRVLPIFKEMGVDVEESLLRYVTRPREMTPERIDAGGVRLQGPAA